MTRDFRNMSSEMPISELTRVLERQNFVFVDSAHIVSRSANGSIVILRGV